MRGIFTFCSAFIATSLLLVLKPSTAGAQATTGCAVATTTCFPTPTEDFNSDNGGFINPVGFIYNQPAGVFRVTDVQNTTNYSLTSGRYLVGSAQTVTTAGFSTSGNGSDDIISFTVNVIDDATGVVLASCVTSTTSQATNLSNGGADRCVTITDADIAGRTVRFQFVFSTDAAAGGPFNFDNFTTALPAAAVTPVEFISLDAKKADNGVSLTWKVASEINVKHYEVERSTNGTTYAKIGTVAATNSNSYSFNDAQSTTGTVYYRVKNVDTDGKFKHSTVISYTNGKTQLQFKVFPTSTNGMVTFQHPSVSGNSAITISTLEGRMLRSVSPARSSISTPVDLSNYPSGTYLIRFQGEGGQSEVFKVFKQ